VLGAESRGELFGGIEYRCGHGEAGPHH
jgi:hypothetical protein